MQTKEFARRVQASFDAAFGSGTSAVEVLGPSPDDVKATAFEVLVRPPFGASFAIPNAQLKNVPEINESAGSIAALSYQLSRDMSESVQQFMNALMLADPTVFMPDKLEPTFDEANREVATEGVFSATKKPVTIQAMLYDGDNAATHAVYQWVEANTQGSYDYLGDERPEHGVSIDPADGAMVIHTLEGEMKVSRGDYVIRGVQGEFYPCKPDIFEATYDIGEVSEAESDVEELKALLDAANDRIAELSTEVDSLNGMLADLEVSE